MDSHDDPKSRQFLVTTWLTISPVAVWSKSTPNSMTIPGHLSRFFLPFSNMTWILDKFKSWNFHGIYQENDGISIGFGLIFEETVVKKTWEHPCHIFYRGFMIYVKYFLIFTPSGVLRSQLDFFLFHCFFLHFKLDTQNSWWAKVRQRGQLNFFCK